MTLVSLGAPGTHERYRVAALEHPSEMQPTERHDNELATDEEIPVSR